MTPRHNDDAPAHAPRVAGWLLWLAGSLVAVPALLPLVVGFLPRLYFDADPRAGFDPGAITAFGPAGAVVWQSIALGCATAALAIALALGAKLRGWLVLLAALGALAAVWQAFQHDANIVPSASWIAGVALAVAGAHVGAFEPARQWMVALVIAMMVPVGLQAGYDVLIQKPRDLAYMRANESALLAERGIEAGSPQHQLLVRRAESAVATGPFAFSNPLGTLAAGGAVLALCVGVGGCFGRSRDRQRVAVAALVAGGCAFAAVGFTGSTGALGGLAIAAGVVGAGWLLLRLCGSRGRRCLPWVAVAALAVPLVAVLVRGAMGPPESMAGERSLLFRFHYWEAAARGITDALPGSALLGVGHEGFAQGYLQHKNPLNPEDVASAHSVFVDWITMLGLGGVAWCGLALLLLLSAGRRVVCADGETIDNEPATPDAPPGSLLQRPAVVAALACAIVLFGTQYLLQSAMMDASLTLTWLAGVAGFVAVAAALGMHALPAPRWVRLGLLGMAAAVLVHSQVEMGFALMATAVPLWFLVGLAGSSDSAAAVASPAQTPRAHRVAGVVLLVGLLCSALFAMVFARPVVRHQSQLAQASRWFALGDPYRALTALERAAEAMPDETVTPRWRLVVRRDEMVGLAQRGDLDAAREAFDLARAVLDECIASGKAPASLHRLRGMFLVESASVLDDPRLLGEAITQYEQLAALSPYNLNDAVTRGDLLWDQGERAAAIEVYRRALKIDRDRYLDTATQLKDDERARIARRVGQP